MKDRQELFRILEVSQALRKYYHDALWEEEKHFTWWVSIVFAALIIVLTSEQLDAWQRVTIITFGSVFGILLSLIGYLVIRREGIYFKDALEMFCRTVISLDLHKPQEHVSDSEIYLPLMPEYPISESFEEARGKANKPFRRLLSGVFRPKTLGVRDCFQLVFVFSGFLFFALIIFTWLTLFR